MIMFEVKCEDDLFLCETWAEIEALFNECCWADGADDVEITVRYAPQE